MKVLFDPIYTTNVAKCATTIKYVGLAEHILAKYPNSYIYWIIPEDLSTEEREWLPKDERIQYIGIYHQTDRYKEHTRLYQDYENIIAYNGTRWDWDVCVTSRTYALPFLKILSIRLGGGNPCKKRIMLIEDMPQMSFKTAVPMAYADIQDAHSMMSYYSADATALASFWEKEAILKAGKKYVSATVLRKVADSIYETVPKEVHDVEFKEKSFVLAMREKTKPFVMSFSGRSVLAHRLDTLFFEIMGKQWAYRGDEVKCVFTTQSKSTGRVNVPDFVELRTYGREEFHNFVKNESSVGIFLSQEEDYPMSLLEPLMLGLPVIVYRCHWSEKTLGEDYPFFIRTPAEAYAMVLEFYTNYAKQYKVFHNWSLNAFLPLLRSRNDMTVQVVFDIVFDQFVDDMWKAKVNESGADNEIINLMDSITKSGEVFLVGDKIRELETLGKLRHYAVHYHPNTTRDSRRSTFTTEPNINRHRLITHFGYTDAGLELGCLKKP